MRMSAVVARLRGILETDWKGEAAKVLAARKASGEGLVCRLTYLLLLQSDPYYSCSFLHCSSIQIILYHIRKTLIYVISNGLY